MPLYEYECGACGHRFEKIQRFSDPLVHECPSCGTGPVQKLLSAPAIQFKGSGWYITDYAGKKSDGTQSSRAADAKADSTPDSKPDAKPEAKPESKPDAKPDAGSGSSSDSKSTASSETGSGGEKK